MKFLIDGKPINNKGGDIMEKRIKESKTKEKYNAPKVLASYSKEELEEAIQPHGDYGSPGCSGGCGCGCGSIL